MNFFSAGIAYASFDTFMTNVATLIINPIIVLLFALAVAFFLYGVFQFISNADNEEKRTEGKNHIMWSIVGLVIMIGVWTILNVILSTFNIGGVDPEQGTVQLEDYNPNFPQIGQ